MHGPHHGGVGLWSAREAGEVLESRNPATGEVLGRVRVASDVDYERVLVSDLAGLGFRSRLPHPTSRGSARP